MILSIHALASRFQDVFALSTIQSNSLITGVLEKCDLTESYNIQPKKNKLTRRHTHHVMVKASIKSLSVKAVEFQEAIIDDNMLRPISRLIKGEGSLTQSQQTRCAVSTRQDSAVRSPMVMLLWCVFAVTVK